ncbi:MAG TPA: hypothetical protein VKV02_14605, partial [Acidobacteriaceae bacterium]|nr:hypothetical protein [Acidobacteriaceae bacterium]
MTQRAPTSGPAPWIPVLVFLLAVALVWPVAETGVIDDWSYARTAELLAATGHIHYNGWATAMLGWPLYPAALAVRMFGFSFTAIRCTTILEACFALWLTHRTFTLVGLPRRSATLGTLTVVFAPVFLLLSVSFMSDIPGYLAVILCLFCCLRALLAESSRGQLAWLIGAALSNAVLGTARQIAWLGVLVMVPCTLWLCRRRREVLIPGLLACLLGWTIMLLSLHWFSVQPYIVPEHLVRQHIGTGAWDSILDFVVRVTLDLALFSLPVVVLFLSRLRGRRSLAVAGVFLLAV